MLGLAIHNLANGFVSGVSGRISEVSAGVFGLAIPLASVPTLALPVPGGSFPGVLTGAAAGVLAYVGTGHLLPAARAEHSSRSSGLLFVAMFVVTTAGLLVLPGG